MIEKQTRKDRILWYLNLRGVESPATCQQITAHIEVAEEIYDHRAKYLSGSISTLLQTMIKNGLIKFAAVKGPNGGRSYIIA